MENHLRLDDSKNLIFLFPQFWDNNGNFPTVKGELVDGYATRSFVFSSRKQIEVSTYCVDLHSDWKKGEFKYVPRIRIPNYLTPKTFREWAYKRLNTGLGWDELFCMAKLTPTLDTSGVIFQIMDNLGRTLWFDQRLKYTTVFDVRHAANGILDANTVREDFNCQSGIDVIIKLNVPDAKSTSNRSPYTPDFDLTGTPSDGYVSSMDDSDFRKFIDSNLEAIKRGFINIQHGKITSVDQKPTLAFVVNTTGGDPTVVLSWFCNLLDHPDVKPKHFVRQPDNQGPIQSFEVLSPAREAISRMRLRCLQICEELFVKGLVQFAYIE